MGDSDVNSRGVKEWLARSVQSFLRWPKWKPVGEWIQRRLSSLFHPTVPKFLAYFIILLAAGWIFWIWLGTPPFNFYFWKGGGAPPLGTIYSTLITVLGMIFSLLLSLTFVGAQIALANFYSPRVMRFLFFSIHFIGLGLFFLGTITFLAWRLGQAQEWGLETSKYAETGFVLFFLMIALLIPYIWISIRVLQPKYLFESLLWSITQNDFRKASGGGRKPREKLDEKLQPVIDIIRRSTKDGQHRTVEQAFEAMGKCFGEMIRRSEEAPLSNQIAVSISGGLFEVGRFANTQESFEVSMGVLQMLKSFIADYIQSATQRASAVILFGTLKKLRDDFVLRYDKKKWPVEHDAVTILFAECKFLIADILSK